VKRTIDVGTVIDKVFKTYGQYFAPLVITAAILFLIDAAFGFVARDSWILGLVSLAISLIISQFYTGVVVELVNDTRDGTLDASIGGLFRAVTPVLATLIGAAIVAGIAIVFGFVLCIIPGIILLTLWAVIAPAIVVEKCGVFDALSRSWNLVKTNFWQTLGVIVVFWLISIVAAGIVGLIFGSGTVVLAVIVRWIVHFLLAPLAALASAILFFELRAVEGTATPPAPSTGPTSTWGTPEAPQ
jgi:hypothetical protein